MQLVYQQLVLGSSAALLALSAATCGSSSSQQVPAQRSSESAGPMARGAELYARYCALCHGKRGEGYAADNANALRNPEFLATASDAFLRVAVARGRVGTPMSAWSTIYGGPLNSSEVESLVKLMRSWQTTPTVSLEQPRVRGRAERGKQHYDEHCAACHGALGEGKTAPTLNNPIFHSTASDSFIRYAIEHGRSDTPMPAFVGALGQQGLDDVTAYVRSLRQGGKRKVAQKLPDVPLIINPKGPAADFKLRDDFYVPVDQVNAALEQGARLVIADARATSDYLEGHIPGAISVPFYSVDDYAERLPKDGTWIIAYCACPHAASGRVARALRDKGFQNTAVLDEGVHVWKQKGYPISQPP